MYKICLESNAVKVIKQTNIVIQTFKILQSMSPWATIHFCQ